MTKLPTGTVTFLFTDIEGSTRHLQRLGPDYPGLLDDHCRMLHKAFDAGGGEVVSTEGDSFFVVFPSAPSAIIAAAQAQQNLADHDWPGGEAVRVRMGMHTGEGLLGGDNYAGIDVHRGARIAAAGHGGQILVSATTRGLVLGHLNEGVELLDLGEHRLKDLEQPEHLYQLQVPGLAGDFPALRSLNSRPNNLPGQLTSFVGRRQEVDAVKHLLRQGRLLTLSGPGGTGKTRLSLAVAGEVIGDFADGVFFVALAPITDPELIPSTIAQALGLQESAARPITDVLEAHLKDKELLLVLDNFEQVVAGATFVSQLLTSAAKVKVLASSREVLHISGEQEYQVPPMGLPDHNNLPPLEALTQFEAVALFIQRGTSVKPAFKVTNENAPAVAEICARLDGLPLAIELAAARLKVLTPQAILERLEHSLKLLTGGGADLPQRQQTLRNAIAWSYDLLDPAEKQMFRRLSVFVGGWVFDTADSICNPHDETGTDTIEGLSSLVDKSLIRQHEDFHGDSRFLMLETIREYGRDLLEEDPEGPMVKQRHADEMCALSEAAEKHFLGKQQKQWLNRIDDEHDNIRSALSWSLGSGEALQGLRTAAAIWRYWHLRGLLREGRKWLTELLAHPGIDGDEFLGKALNALGSVAYWQNDFEETRRCYSGALKVFTRRSDKPGEAETLYNLAYLEAVEKNYDASRRFYEEASGMYEELGNKQSWAYAEFGRGLVDWLDETHDREKALIQMDEVLKTFRELGDKFGEANALGVKARLHFEMRHDNWLPFYLDLIRIYEEIGDLSGIAWTLDELAFILITSGKAQEGVRIGGAAQAIKDKIGGEAPRSLTKYKDPRVLAASMLSPEQIEGSWQEGLATSSDEAIAYIRQPDLVPGTF